VGPPPLGLPITVSTSLGNAIQTLSDGIEGAMRWVTGR
jgi:hypothetical protein